MKISEQWLREWVSPALSREELCEKMTMAGLEVEEIVPAAKDFSGVVVAKVLKVEKHPDADRLRVCEVDVGGSELLTIVCGAKNVAVGMKTAAALEGAVLPGDFKIKASKLRGVLSHGMLCAADELGLAEKSEGLMVLADDAPVGENLWQYFDLADHIIDVSITPNRGDCLSVAGLAQDIAAITRTQLHVRNIPAVAAQIPDILNVTLKTEEQCPHYAGRIIRNVAADAATPVWMQERLRRSGIRCISPIVDVMNYVMLELGQPMHAFDLTKISGDIQVRMARADETLELLDAQTVTLTPETLIIADQQKPLAIAGVMGGMESAVTALTKDVFLESAYFQPMCISKTSRHYKLISDSSYRFERGVDPTLQHRALERATQLILDIAGGTPGKVIGAVSEAHLPKQKEIPLRLERSKKILGFEIATAEVEAILTSLGFAVEKNNVSVPARRFDVNTEIDLIEEIIRIYGYEKIPAHQPVSGMQMAPRSEKKVSLQILRDTLCDLGYQEIVAYSFIDKKMQQLFDPDIQPKELLNPITAEMSVMRTSLLPGLINTLLYNQNRQQTRVRIFETGLRFIPDLKTGAIEQQSMLGGLTSGSVYPEQWGVPQRPVDFFDLKGDIENILRLTFSAQNFEFRPGRHHALHPAQTADIYRDGRKVGMIGAIHPTIAQSLDLNEKVFVFELALSALEAAQLPKFSEVSRFPENRRDVAILVDKSVPANLIQDTIRHVAGELLQDVNIFDVYQGKGVTDGQKSLALSLVLQHPTRTLVDEEVAALMEHVVTTLKEKFAAELRG